MRPWVQSPSTEAHAPLVQAPRKLHVETSLPSGGQACPMLQQGYQATSNPGDSMCCLCLFV